MKLKPVKRKVTPLPVVQKEEEKKPITRKKSSLPSDEYKPIFEPIRFLVREEPSRKDPTKVVKQYLELSVKRYNDELGLPYVWCAMYQESEFYTGYLKGHTVYLPLEMLEDLIERLNTLSEECDKRKIE